jgi:hypothetical protein
MATQSLLESLDLDSWYSMIQKTAIRIKYSVIPLAIDTNGNEMLWVGLKLVGKAAL